MMSRRSRGRNSTHDVLNYSNPGKESWSGHGAFRGARRRRRVGARAYGVPSHAGGLPTNTGERWGGEKWTNAGICGHYGLWVYLDIQHPAGASPHLALSVCRPFGSMDPPVPGWFRRWLVRDLRHDAAGCCSSQNT